MLTHRKWKYQAFWFQAAMVLTNHPKLLQMMQHNAQSPFYMRKSWACPACVLMVSMLFFYKTKTDTLARWNDSNELRRKRFYICVIHHMATGARTGPEWSLESATPSRKLPSSGEGSRCPAYFMLFQAHWQVQEQNYSNLIIEQHCGTGALPKDQLCNIFWSFCT